MRITNASDQFTISKTELAYFSLQSLVLHCHIANSLFQSDVLLKWNKNKASRVEHSQTKKVSISSSSLPKESIPLNFYVSSTCCKALFIRNSIPAVL